MKLQNLRKVGRYINPETQRAVNIHKGTTREGWDYLFYYFRQKRQIIPESAFWGKWKREEEK